MIFLQDKKREIMENQRKIDLKHQSERKKIIRPPQGIVHHNWRSGGRGRGKGRGIRR